MEGYEFPPLCKEVNKYGGGKMVQIRDGIIARRLENLEEKTVKQFS